MPIGKLSVFAFCVSLAAATGLSATAAAPKDPLEGRYGFNWASDPAKAKCAKVEGALLKTLRSKAYRCDLKEKTNSASGNPVVTCTRAKPVIEYLIFKTRAQCEEERTTQESNGD